MLADLLTFPPNEKGGRKRGEIVKEEEQQEISPSYPAALPSLTIEGGGGNSPII